MMQLEIDSVQLKYGQKTILSDVYLYCAQGSVVGLLGRNGSGKSSLLQIIFGTHPLQEYSLRINQRSIKAAYKSKIGMSYLPQFNFIPAGLSVAQVLKDYGLQFEELAERVPELAARRQTGVRHLSGGTRRLLEVYLCLFKSGSFILLDEPFTHLSPLHMALVSDWINIVKANKGIIISDHLYEQLLPICDAYYLVHEAKTLLCKDRDSLISFGYLNA